MLHPAAAGTTPPSTGHIVAGIALSTGRIVASIAAAVWPSG
jgi:hypothetical protein